MTAAHWLPETADPRFSTGSVTVTPAFCGWEIPDYPLYVCIQDAHGPETPHQPVWITDVVREALCKLRNAGRAGGP